MTGPRDCTVTATPKRVASKERIGPPLDKRVGSEAGQSIRAKCSADKTQTEPRCVTRGVNRGASPSQPRFWFSGQFTQFQYTTLKSIQRGLNAARGGWLFHVTQCQCSAQSSIIICMVASRVYIIQIYFTSLASASYQARHPFCPPRISHTDARFTRLTVSDRVG